MATRMQQRRGTAEQWTTINPVLAEGEIGLETDTNNFKIGNGVDDWSTLDYPAVDIARVDGLQDELDSKAPLTQGVESLNADYTLVASDAGKIRTCYTTGTNTISVPGNVFATGDRVDIISTGPGSLVIAGTSGATLFAAEDKLTIDTQYAAATVIFLNPVNAVVVGRLA